MNILNRIWPWSKIHYLQSERIRLRSMEVRLILRASGAEHRLDRIAAQETPNANATVKRMAKIARGEG